MSWSLVIAPLTIVCLALAVIFAAEVLYADRALPGVTVAGVDIGSLTRSAAQDRLQLELSAPWATSAVVARSEGRTWATTNGALAVHPDVAAAAAAAVSYGKDGT